MWPIFWPIFVSVRSAFSHQRGRPLQALLRSPDQELLAYLRYKPVLDPDPLSRSAPFSKDGLHMTPRGGRVWKAPLLPLSLGADPPPTGFDHIVAEQVDAHPDAIVSRDILGRVESAQVDETGRKGTFHRGRISMPSPLVSWLI